MTLRERFKKNKCIKNGLLLLCGLTFISHLQVEASCTYPIVEQPIRMSPPPAQFDDPVLDNLQLVMDNNYQLPWYPGGSPDYLSQIYYFSHYPILGPTAINPVDDRIMNFEMGQNVIKDQTNSFNNGIVGIVTNTFITSFDTGRTFNLGPPIEQIIPLGGTLSQRINASLGPGLALTYNKEGKLYASGQGFDDMVANPPNTQPETGFLFTSSSDFGKTWDPFNIVFTSLVSWAFLPPSPVAISFGPREFYTAFYPPDNNLIHATTMQALVPYFPEWTQIAYFNSKDAGKTFSKQKVVYNLIDDPVWKSKFFNQNLSRSAPYEGWGGASLNSAAPFNVDKDVLLLPLFRFFPNKTTTSWDYFPSTSTTDQGVIRSTDNGKTWSNIATAGDTFLHNFGLADPAFGPDFNVPRFYNGFEVFGFLADGSGQSSHPILSPYTGRIYFTYAAGNPAADPDPDLAFNYPRVLLSSSPDKGLTWSPAVQINRTPTNISFGAQMCFSSGAAFTQNGQYCVAYYDFRNWTGQPGEDLNLPLNTDVWVAIYNEVDDPHGGSTGVGLDFVKEIRLTSESFDSRNPLRTTIPPYVSNYCTGTPEGIRMAVNNHNDLFIIYSTTFPGSPSNIQTNAYRGMTVDTNGYVAIYIQKLIFPKSSNE